MPWTRSDQQWLGIVLIAVSLSMSGLLAYDHYSRDFSEVCRSYTEN